MLTISVRSPKSCPLPVEPIVIYSITFEFPAFPVPPANKPLVEEAAEPRFIRATVRSPKSVELPVDPIVTYSITSFTVPVSPPPRIPLVEFVKADGPWTAALRSPKSEALPEEVRS